MIFLPNLNYSRKTWGDHKLFNFLNAKKRVKISELEFIKKYTIDITSLALNNKIDPIIGRDEEIKRTIQIISRRTKK